LPTPSPYARLRTVLMASMTLVPLVPFLCVMAIGYRYFTRALETNTLSAMARIVADHRRMIDSFLSERRADLSFITRAYDFEQVKRPEVLSELFENLQRAAHAYVDLGVFDTNGLLVAYRGPYSLTGKIYKETDWFREAERRGYYIGDVFLGYRNIPHFIVAVCRNSPQGRWMIRATIDSLLFNDLVKKVRLGKTGEAYVINSEGVLQTDRRSGGDLMQILDDAVERPKTQEQIRTFLAKDTPGTSYLYATALLKGGEWMLIARQEQSDAFSALHSAAYLILFITGICGLVVVVIAQFMTGRIVRHMERTDAEKDRLRYQLIGAARLVELGEMAAGFAHEVNNPLQIIPNEQSLMEMTLAELPLAGTGTEEGPLAEIHQAGGKRKRPGSFGLQRHRRHAGRDHGGRKPAGGGNRFFAPLPRRRTSGTGGKPNAISPALRPRLSACPRRPIHHRHGKQEASTGSLYRRKDRPETRTAPRS